MGVLNYCGHVVDRADKHTCLVLRWVRGVVVFPERGGPALARRGCNFFCTMTEQVNSVRYLATTEQEFSIFSPT